jgi:glutathione synthase/RimK-type ligase-like ATP-grasp enzyme
MKILLIGNKETSHDKEAYYTFYDEFFRDALATTEVAAEITHTLFDDLHISIGDGEFVIVDTRHGKDLADYDAVLIRGKGFRNYFDVVRAISRYCTLHNVPIINDYKGFRDSSKLAQALQFFELDIPVAKTVYVTEAVLSQKVPLGFDFPCIMKATFGAHGNDNYLVKDMAEAKKIASEDESKKFVMQRFVPNDNDYRVLVVGDETLVISRAASENSHLNNTSQGGSAELAHTETLPEWVLQASIKVSRHLDMTFAGVDVLADKNTGDFFFLEVNSQPQLMSGAFVDEKKKIVGRYLASLS